jgi:threonine-phosphate decarboxylase
MDGLCLQRRARLLGAVVNPSNGHGGNIYRAAREQHRRPSELYDFSASINPLGPPGRVLRALRKGLWAIRHYPDPDAHDLRVVLGKQTGLPPDWFLIGNGSAELIDLLPRGLGIARALVVGPTFSEYEAAIRQAGGDCLYCLADRKEDYRPPLDRVMTRVYKDRHIEAVFLCNPNSPTGQVVARNEVLSLIDALNRLGRWLILDEAFVEFTPDESMLDVLSQYSRFVILRSCTKFFGIPGLRLGYLVCRPAVLEQVRRRQVPWSVNALAQMAAIAALQETAYRRQSLSLIQKERAWLQSALRAIPGVRVFPSAANFLLLELPPSMPAGRAADWLCRTGILVRDCSNVAGLNKRTIRIAVRRRRDNERLCRALEGILHG